MQNINQSKPKNPTLTFSELSQEGQLRLVDLAFHSLAFGISSIPFCAAAFSIWAYTLRLNLFGLWIWGGIYTIATVVIHLMHRAYLQDRKNEAMSGHSQNGCF